MDSIREEIKKSVIQTDSFGYLESSIQKKREEGEKIHDKWIKLSPRNWHYVVINDIKQSELEIQLIETIEKSE